MQGLSLKNLKVHHGLSEETTCYEASLYLNGKLVAFLCNNGQGAPDRQQFKDRAIEKQIEDWFKSQPEKVSRDGSFSYPYNLETWVGEQIERSLTVKDYRKKSKKMISAISADGKFLRWPKIPVSNLELHRKSLLEKYPGVIFIQDLSDDQLYAALIKHVED
jgi:hypothetical protein